MNLLTGKLTTRYNILSPLLVGGLCAALALTVTQLSLGWTAAVVLLACGLAILAIVGQARGPLLALLVFVVPLHLEKIFIWRQAHQGGPSGLIVSAADVILFGLLCLWLVEAALRHRRIRFFPSTSLPALVFIAAGLASTGIAPDPAFGSFQLFQYAKGFILYLYLANCVLDKRDTTWVLAGLMAAVMFESGLGLYEVIQQRPLGLVFLGEVTTDLELGVGQWEGVRARGTLYSYNILSMYLGMTLPVLIAVFFAPVRRAVRVLVGVVTFVGLVTLVCTLSRGGWIGILISSLALLVLYPKASPAALVRRLSLGIPVLLILVFVLNLLTGGEVIHRLSQDDQGAAAARIPLMRGALAMIADHPAIGVGLNNYQLGLRQYDPTGGLAQYGGSGVVHNSFLLMAAETGLVGLAAFTWLLAALIRRALAFLAGQPASWTTCLTAGILASNVHVIVHNLVEYGILGDAQLFVWFWCLAGLLVAVSARNDCPASSLVVREKK